MPCRRCCDIVWTNVGFWLLWALGSNSNEICIKHGYFHIRSNQALVQLSWNDPGGLPCIYYTRIILDMGPVNEWHCDLVFHSCSQWSLLCTWYSLFRQVKYMDHANITGCHSIFSSVLKSNVIDYYYIPCIYTTRVSLATMYKQELTGATQHTYLYSRRH